MTDAISPDGVGARPDWRDRALTAYARRDYHPGKARLERLARRVLGLDVMRAESPAGVKYLLVPDEVVQREILLRGAYEPRTLALVTRLLKPGDTMVDVGGHVGQYALHAALAVGPSGRVVSFEPNPHTYQFLRRNVALNGVADRVVAVLGAVDDAPGVAPMTLGLEENWGLASRADGAHAHGAPPSFHAATVRLDAALAALAVRRVDVLKVDVEGYELNVLRSLDLASALRPRHIVFEFIPGQMAACGSDPETLLGHLAVHGYELCGVDGAPFGDAAALAECNVWARDVRGAAGGTP
jgi:FkbM family methyltransferase